MSECPSVVCANRVISCENDFSVIQIPRFSIIIDSHTSEWNEMIIRNTNISKIYASSFQAFRNTTMISILDLSNNQIEYIENESFLPLKNSIRKLILSNNRLIEFQLDSILSIRLEQLYLNNNKLNELHVVNNNETIKYTNLKGLYLSGNNFSILPISIQLLTSLTYLDLSFNPILSLPRYSFNTLISLKMLNLNGLDSLCCLNIETFSGLNNLLYLYLTAPSKFGFEPDICWFNSLKMLKEFSYNTTYLVTKQNISLETFDFCSLCWIYLLRNVKNISVINPNCSIDSNKTYLCQQKSSNLCDLNRDYFQSFSNISGKLGVDNSTTTDVTTTTSNNNNIILGAVLGTFCFLLLIMIVSVIVYNKRKKKCCFKDNHDSDEIESPKDDFNRNNQLNVAVNDGNNNTYVKKQESDDDYLNKIGEIVNIYELSDSSFNTFNYVDDNNNKNVRFDSDILILNNNRKNNNNNVARVMINESKESLSGSIASIQSDMIQTIYEDDNENVSSTIEEDLRSNLKMPNVNEDVTNETVDLNINTKL